MKICDLQNGNLLISTLICEQKWIDDDRGENLCAETKNLNGKKNYAECPSPILRK